MKKQLLSAVMLCLVAVCGSIYNVSAADQNNNDNKEKKEPHIAGYITNPFKDNWEIQAGVGPTFNLHVNNCFKHSTMVAGHIAAGKWITPVFGVRLDFELGQYGQVERTPQFVSFEKNDNWTYIYLHPDFQINLSNWIGGYKDYRVYTAVLYAGAGFSAAGMNLKNDDYYYECPSYHFLTNIGLQNRFAVSKAVSIDLQLQFTLGKGIARPVGGYNLGHFFGLSAMAGFTYKFNDRTWRRSGGTVEEVDALKNTLDNYKNKADLAGKERDALKKELDNQKAENLKTKDELAAERDRAARERAEREARYRQANNAKEAIDRDVYDEILFYEIGHGTLTEYHKQRLDLIAEHIKNDNEKQVYKVEGFADPQTGSPQCNARLANKRAQLAYEYLLAKGVPAERLQYINGGTTNCPFGKPIHNRVVVVY